MRTIVNATKKPIVVKLIPRRPTAFGTHEIVFAGPNLALPPREPVQVKDEDAANIVARHGRKGIVELLPGETVQDAILNGLTIRHEMLTNTITAFRETQAMRQAGGLGITLPRREHRDALKEIDEIAKEMLAIDPVLAGALDHARADQEKVPDALAADMAAMGIPASAAPMAPGVADELLGIG